jgi:hypothetical protein
MTGSGWIRLGRVLQAAGGPHERSHVMLPTPLVLDDRVRVYFASCDDDMRGRIFAAEFERKPPFAVIGRWREPALDIGSGGAFDRDGVNPSQVIEIDGRLVLLYIGWRRGDPETPYALIAGLAVSTDGGHSFTSEGPLLAPREGESLFRTAPFMVREPGGWRLLYIGGDRFITDAAGTRLPIYSLMDLHSNDPLNWPGPGRELIAPNLAAGQIGFGRPVLCGARLMVSVRTAAGYELVEGDDPATTSDRAPLTPVFTSPFETWESQMRCFGAPCLVGDYELLFYNGDGFGRTGLGLAYRPIASR